MQKKMDWLFLTILTLFAVVNFLPHKVIAEEAGTVGLNVAQLYNDHQPNKRGVLVVTWVDQGSSAAEAGIQAGDVIIAVNGSSVIGTDPSEILRKDLGGTAGGNVRVTVVRRNDAPREIVLTRRPYPPHLNSESDPFRYSVPGDWQMDLRYPFPLPWSPVIDHKGIEDLAFAPGFDDTASPEYHSYLILWWLEGSNPLTAARLQSDMIAYFRGLAEQRGRNNHFVPDLSKVAAEYSDSDRGPQTFGGAPAKSFNGSVTIYDRHGQVITLNSEVVASVCSAADHTAVFFSMSLAPRPAALWSQLDAVRDGFKCSR